MSWLARICPRHIKSRRVCNIICSPGLILWPLHGSVGKCLDQIAQPIGAHEVRIEAIGFAVVLKEVGIAFVMGNVRYPADESALDYRLHRNQRYLRMATVTQNTLECCRDDAFTPFEHVG